MRREEVLRKLREGYPEFVERFGVASLYLFGSTARDDARSDSDVDLLVEFCQPVGLIKFVELKQHLESLLSCSVDLGTPRSLKLHLRDQVLSEAVRVA